MPLSKLGDISEDEVELFARKFLGREVYVKDYPKLLDGADQLKIMYLSDNGEVVTTAAGKIVGFTAKRNCLLVSFSGVGHNIERMDKHADIIVLDDGAKDAWFVYPEETWFEDKLKTSHGNVVRCPRCSSLSIVLFTSVECPNWRCQNYRH